MTELSPDAVAGLLRRAGLHADVFDPAEIAADLDSWFAAGEELAAFLGDFGDDASSFDPSWH